VTYISLVAAVGLMIFAAFGGHAGLVWAPALIIAWELIDVTDGTMARALKMRDNFGGFVDYASGMVLLAFLHLALAIGVVQTPDGSLASLLPHLGIDRPVPVWFIVACGGAISAISMYMRVINRTLQVRFRDSLSDDSESLPGSGVGKAGRVIIRNLETVGGIQAIVYSLAAAFGVLEATIFFYLVLYLLLLPAFAVSVYRNFSRITAYPER
jgi:phosphatidylglycerophosphate synthase